MNRSPIRRILTTLALPAGVVVATAAPTVAAATDAAPMAHSNPAVAMWRPPMPCFAVRAGVYPPGTGLCPGPTGGPDWNKIRTASKPPKRAIVVPSIIWDVTNHRTIGR
jgi:hypothetical protein